MKDNAYLLRSPWIEAVQNLYLSSGTLKTCIASYKNNYLKMHGKHKIRQVAGRKSKRKFHNQFSDNARSIGFWESNLPQTNYADGTRIHIEFV